MISLQAHPKFQRGLDLVLEAVAELQAGAPTGAEDGGVYARRLQRVARLRGRPLFFPYTGSGLGHGARVQTADGRWLLDFAIGIGVHFFGHSHPDLLRTALDAAAITAYAVRTSSVDLEALANVEWGVPVLYSRLPNGALFPERIKGLVLICGSYGKVTQSFRGVPILDKILPKVMDIVEGTSRDISAAQGIPRGGTWSPEDVILFATEGNGRWLHQPQTARM